MKEVGNETWPWIMEYKPTRRDYFLAKVLASLLSGDDHGLDLYEMKDSDIVRDKKIVNRAINIVDILLDKEQQSWIDMNKSVSK